MRTCLVLSTLTIVLLTSSLGAEAQTVGEVFRKALPSVVTIRGKGRDVSERGNVTFTETGAGVLVSSDGKVMTAAHIVQAMDEIKVEFRSGEPVSARVVASEPAADVALLQVDRMPPDVPTATLADSDSVLVGDQVLVIGAPYGLRYSMTAGWISARWPPNTVYRAMPLAEFFQTDAVINAGNSGGPMFNMAGHVIGIVSHNITTSGGSEGLGFVVTINTAKALLLQQRAFWSGVEGRLLTKAQAAILNVPQASGYLVQRVAKGSPLDQAGLRAGTKLATIDGERMIVGGDVILSIAGTPVTTVADILQTRMRLTGAPPGSTRIITVLRAGHVIELTVTSP